MHSKESSTRVPTQITCKFLDSTTVAEGRRRGRNYRREPHSVNLCIQTLSHPPREPRGPSVREGAHYRERNLSVNAMSHLASEESQLLGRQGVSSSAPDRSLVKSRPNGDIRPPGALPNVICASRPGSDTCRRAGNGPDSSP